MWRSRAEVAKQQAEFLFHVEAGELDTYTININITSMTDTEIVNFRYTFLPFPIVLGVKIPKDEWRTATIATYALKELRTRHGPDVESAVMQEIPSPLLVKLQHRRSSGLDTGVTTTSRTPRRQEYAPELTDTFLRNHTSLYAYVQEQDNCIIDLAERTEKRVFPYVKELIATAFVLLALFLYLGGSPWTILRQTASSAIISYFIMIMTCKCRVVAR
jgi:hypothetical protein